MDLCGDIYNSEHIRGVLYYGNNTGQKPLDRADFTNDKQCVDEKQSDISPYLVKEVPWPWPTLENATQFGELKPNGIYASKLFDANFFKRNTQAIMQWRVNNETLFVDWEEPTLKSIIQGKATNSSNAVILPSNVEWFYLLLNNAQQPSTSSNGSPAIHPMHLHAHDFYILSEVTSPWNGTVSTLNPPRRDSAILTSGHLLLAWKVGNPGVWLFHCHLGWNTEMGFDLQFIEHPESIPSITNLAALEENCQEWKFSAHKWNIVKQPNDSGV